MLSPMLYNVPSSLNSSQLVKAIGHDRYQIAMSFAFLQLQPTTADTKGEPTPPTWTVRGLCSIMLTMRSDHAFVPSLH